MSETMWNLIFKIVENEKKTRPLDELDKNQSISGMSSEAIYFCVKIATRKQRYPFLFSTEKISRELEQLA